MTEKLRIDKLILVEGKYDKIRLQNIVNADIFVLNGFGIFKNSTAVNSIKNIAGKRDVLILTDSDTAGYKIRVYLNKVLSGNRIINVFVPQLKGKEKRKNEHSAQGFLGVEGIPDEVLLNALNSFASTSAENNDEITATHLYLLGYSGTEGAVARKNKLLDYLGVQGNISNKFLLRILNDRYSLDEFEKLLIDGGE